MASNRPKRDRKQVYDLSSVLSLLSDQEDSSGSEYKADGDDSPSEEQDIAAVENDLPQPDQHHVESPDSTSISPQKDTLEPETDRLQTGIPSAASSNSQIVVPEDAGNTDTTSGRKRKRDETGWNRNKRKEARNRGREYTNEKGNIVPARHPQSVQCKCHYKCSDTISEDARKKVCEAYWASGEYVRQRDYIVRNVKIMERGRSTTVGESRRQSTYHYHLTTSGGTVRVCKAFFLATLNIGQRTVYYALNDKTHAGASSAEGFTSPDRRGKNAPKNKSSYADKAFLKAHIESFPAVESHYCRQRTKRKYLDSSLNVKKMHELYEERCKKENRIPLKIHVYRDIFNSEYNFAFHKPKKDECSLCDRFKKASTVEKETMSAEYQAHQARKIQAREHKESDKKRAIENPETVRSINFDLQKVLQTPQMKVSNLYYSRKLSTYNFSIYDQASKSAKCYMWHEGLAKRGSNEIASCVFDHLKTLPPTVQEMNFFSDTCSGQQRNCNFCTMCLYAVQKLPLNVINHKYFESGHSQMEGDSVHSTIERTTKGSDIFSPSEWYGAVRMAKRTQPKYEVVEVDTPDVIDFKSMAEECFTNRKMADDGTSLMWMKVKWWQYRADMPSQIYFKYQMDEPEFTCITVNRATRRGRVKQIGNAKVQCAYNERPKIAEAKYRDLMKLCTAGHIPSVHHEFYQNLQHGANVRDRLAESDAEEDDVSDDE